ncbi:MAG: DNA-3-methyladenine glycosylase [Candidatus Nanohaloarchaea archaeon]
MNSFELEPDNFDLELTLTCGQTFCWNRIDGELYGEGGSRFYTFRRGEPVIVEDQGDSLFVQTELSPLKVRKALGLHRDLEEIFSQFPEDEKLWKAMEEFWGLRVVQDEFFPCLISYLLSPQMRIPRIKKMHNEIARRFGEEVEVEGEKLLRFPGRDELSGVSEQELRDIGVGYRAKYVVETLDILGNGFDETDLEEMDYFEAREHLKKLYGVGDKVADCVLLFSKGFHEAPPLDTWARKALQQHYPELHSEDYDEAVENIHSRFGDHSGYAVEYLFHAARQGVLEVD